MKKTLLFATALMLGTPAAFTGVAMAQDAGMQAPAGDPAAGPSGANPAPDAATPATPDQPMAPDANAAGQPAADAPMGAGSPPPAAAAPGGQPMAGAPAAGDPSTYPACSRTVKDRCKNRGGR